MSDDNLFDLRDAVFDSVHDFAKRDSNLVFITSDMGAWSLSNFRQDLPQQFINIGICEQTMLGMAAGMASNGFRVVVYAIIPFLALRSLEHIKLDICMPDLPVTIIGGGPGLTYASDGPTHHALDDLSPMMNNPNLEIYTPATAQAGEMSVRDALINSGPSYIRLDKVQVPNISWSRQCSGFSLLGGEARHLVITSGTLLHDLVEVRSVLSQQNKIVDILHVDRLSAVKEPGFLSCLSMYDSVCVAEEQLYTSGLHALLPALFVDNTITIPMLRMGVESTAIFRYGDRQWMREHVGLGVENITNKLANFISSCESGE